MVPNTGIKASSPRDETHPKNITATCFLSSQQIKCEQTDKIRYPDKIRGFTLFRGYKKDVRSMMKV